MTKEQLKAKINALTIGDSRALEKQGGTLSSILNGIIDLIPSRVVDCPILSIVDLDVDGVTGTLDEILDHIRYNGEKINYSRFKNIFINGRVWPTIIVQMPEEVVGNNLEELSVSYVFHDSRQQYERLRICIGIGIDAGFSAPGIVIELNKSNNNGSIEVLYF